MTAPALRAEADDGVPTTGAAPRRRLAAVARVPATTGREARAGRPRRRGPRPGLVIGPRLPVEPPAVLIDPRSSEGPRDRLWRLGPSALSNVELIALVLGTGMRGDGVLAVARRIVATADDSLRRLAAEPGPALLRVPGVGSAKAARLLAVFELAARLAEEERPRRPRIREPRDVVRLFQARLRDLTVEEFHMLALDSQSQVLRSVLITRGLLNSSLVHPREVFRAAIAEAAAGIIVVHNHPSGDPTPSVEDRAVTRQLAEAGQLLDLPLYDHVIIAGDRWVSFGVQGLL